MACEIERCDLTHPLAVTRGVTVAGIEGMGQRSDELETGRLQAVTRLRESPMPRG